MKFKDSKSEELKKLERYFCFLIKNSKPVREAIKELIDDGNSTELKNCITGDDTEKIQLKKQVEELEKELDEIKGLKSRDDKKYQGIIDELREEKEEITEELETLRNSVDNIRQKNENLRDETEELREQNTKTQDELDKAVAELGNLKAQISEPLYYLERYRKLPETIRVGLSNVICDKSLVNFIASCSEDDNLRALWSYTKDIMNDDYDAETIETLKEIFDYFFAVYNSSLSDVKYIRDDVAVGDELDDEYYDRGRGSLTSGEIKEIILRGYKSRNTGRIICRSVVRS